MNKKELINAIFDATEGITKKDIDAVIVAFEEQVIKAVAEGQDVKLTGFGTFGHSDRAAREGRNPATGEPMHIDATKSPKFKAGTAFKAALK